MNPDTQNPTQEPDQHDGMGDMPQAPTTGTGDDTQTSAPTMPAGDNGEETPEAPETPAGGDAPETPAPDESDKDDGAKW